MKKQKKQKGTGRRKSTMRRTRRKEPAWTGEMAYAGQKKCIGRVHVPPEVLGYAHNERVRTGTVQPSSPFDLRAGAVQVAFDELSTALAELEHRLEPILGSAPPPSGGADVPQPNSDVRVLGVLENAEHRVRSLHDGVTALTDRLVI